MIRNRFLLPLLLLVLALPAAGESFQQQIRRADGFLKGGQPEKALKAYQDMLVDYPDAAHVLYGIGAAYYQRAEEQADAGLATEAAETFTSAEQAFARLAGADDPEIQQHTAFNRANCAAWRAQLLAPDPEHVPQQQWKETVAQLRAAVSTYDEVLREYPELAAAQQNRNHMRYLLKQVLRNPPPPPEEEPQQQPPPPDKGSSAFTEVATDLENADTRLSPEGDIAELVVKPGAGGQP